MAERKFHTSAILATGVALGAALGAAAILLTDKKNQQKMSKAIKKAKQWVGEEKDAMVKQIIEKQEEEEDFVQVKKTPRKKTTHTTRRSVN